MSVGHVMYLADAGREDLRRELDHSTGYRTAAGGCGDALLFLLERGGDGQVVQREEHSAELPTKHGHIGLTVDHPPGGDTTLSTAHDHDLTADHPPGGNRTLSTNSVCKTTTVKAPCIRRYTICVMKSSSADVTGKFCKCTHLPGELELSRCIKNQFHPTTA